MISTFAFSPKIRWFRSSKIRALLTVILTALVFIPCILFIYYDNTNLLNTCGYPGVFIAGFIAGSSIPVPLPYVVVTFTMGGVSDPNLVGILSGLGAGLGGSLFYILCRNSILLASELIPTGQLGLTNNKWQKVVAFSQRHQSAAIFTISVLINPAFTLMAITLATLGYSRMKFLIWCCAGNLIKSLFIAYCGYYGLSALPQLFGG